MTIAATAHEQALKALTAHTKNLWAIRAGVDYAAQMCTLLMFAHYVLLHQPDCTAVSVTPDDDDGVGWRIQAITVAGRDEAVFEGDDGWNDALDETQMREYMMSVDDELPGWDFVDARKLGRDELARIDLHALLATLSEAAGRVIDPVPDLSSPTAVENWLSEHTEWFSR